MRAGSDSHRQKDHTPRATRRETAFRVIRWSAFVSSLAGMFLLGCFVVGPRLSRLQHAPTPYESVVVSEPDAPELTPQRVASVIPPPSAEVTITERSDAASSAPIREHADSASDPAAQESLSEASQSSGKTPETESAAAQPVFRVRAGLFAGRTNANSLAGELRSSGFEATVRTMELSGRKMYAVQVGVFEDRSRAESLAGELSRAGYQSTIVTDN
ncbi:MAG: SPOR domain-containing protein [Armatimonadetes bacterium]|nr:SPOR domain-containing protein [Armatimonadota bacterium]